MNCGWLKGLLRKWKERNPNEKDQNSHEDQISISTQYITASQTSFPLSSVLNYSLLSNSHLNFTLAISSHDEPKTYQQVVVHGHWQQAMKSELEGLQLNHTRILTTLLDDKVPIECKLVYKIKWEILATLCLALSLQQSLNDWMKSMWVPPLWKWDLLY